MNIFNTLTRTKTPFRPIVAGKVKMYLCGPTVYDEPHLGHARSAVVYDVIRRYLKARGYTVTYVRNITDIDDKIIEKANQRHQDYRKLSAHYIDRYHDVMAQLNVLSPDVEPKATDFILPIFDFISSLIQKGHAYTSSGNVYFAVQSFKAYGRLSGRSSHSSPEETLAVVGTGKQHPADFALWRASKPWTPSWPSPWGPGRPGWHIECSAMSLKLLGEVFDIHGGGVDLIFPHHENEIAQSQSISGTSPANYWIHNGLVQINGKKMSKSLGNYPALNDLLAVYPAGALRLLMLSKRYRHPLEFRPVALRSAVKNFARLERFCSQWNVSPVAPAETSKRTGSLWSQFCFAMDDDFNFPMALSVVFQGVRRINQILATASDVLRASECPEGIKTVVAEMAFICRDILGIEFETAVASVTGKHQKFQSNGKQCTAQLPHLEGSPISSQS